MERKEIFDIFAGQVCDGCHGMKKRWHAFCPPCYHQLPRALQVSLWKRFGEGFEEAYHASLSWFREHPFQGVHRAKQEKLFG